MYDKQEKRALLMFNGQQVRRMNNVDAGKIALGFVRIS